VLAKVTTLSAMAAAIAARPKNNTILCFNPSFWGMLSQLMDTAWQ
jgi:hypothetical protein